MAWSTRELAELADTTVRTVRHYHDVGLLEEPERRPNGYKQYHVAHLVRLRRIKQLVDLGFTLVEIGAMGEHDPSPQALCALDAELSATVERLQRARSELGTILSRASTVDPRTARVGGAHRGRRPLAIHPSPSRQDGVSIPALRLCDGVEPVHRT